MVEAFRGTRGHTGGLGARGADGLAAWVKEVLDGCTGPASSWLSISRHKLWKCSKLWYALGGTSAGPPRSASMPERLARRPSFMKASGVRGGYLFEFRPHGCPCREEFKTTHAMRSAASDCRKRWPTGTAKAKWEIEASAWLARSTRSIVAIWHIWSKLAS